jgi:hypothetical protein
MKERRLIAEQQAMREKSLPNKQGSDFAATPSSQAPSQKKMSAAERIGYRKSYR